MRRFSFTFKSDFGLMVLGSVLLIGVGCDSPRGTDEADLYAPPPAVLSQVNFAELSSSVLTPHCLQCHAAFESESGVLPYVVVGNPEQSKLYSDIADGTMPPGGPPLSPASLELVATYINDLAIAPGSRTDSAPSISPRPSASPDSSGAFATLETRVLTPSCIRCHAAFTTPAGLTPYLVAGDPDHSTLYEDSASGKMPPGGPAVSVDDLSVIRDYIQSL